MHLPRLRKELNFSSVIQGLLLARLAEPYARTQCLVCYVHMKREPRESTFKEYAGLFSHGQETESKRLMWWDY
jgi:hypothetical protein